jgi:hypothetical protein
VAECTRLLHAYAVAVDHGDAAAMTALFTDDGRILRGTLALSGRAELPQILAGRPDDLVMRHLLTTVLVTPDGTGGGASALVYYALYRGQGTPPLPMPQPFSLGEWHCRFARTAAGWRIAQLEIRRLFVRPPEAG